MIRQRNSGARNTILALAVGAGVAMAPKAAVAQTNGQASAMLRKEPQSFYFDASTIFVTKSTRANGRVVGEGPANQSTLDLNVGGNLTGTLWTDYDFATEKFNEIDLDLTAHGQFAEIREGTFKGTFTWSLGFQDWKYPTPVLGTHDDYVLFSSVTYNGPVTVSLADRHLLDNHWSWDRNCVKLDISRSFKVLSLGKSTFTLIPCVSVAYNDNMAGDTGYRYITYGLTANWSCGAWTAGAFVREQRNISSKVESLPYAGIAITVSDLGRGFKQLLGR